MQVFPVPSRAGTSVISSPQLSDLNLIHTPAIVGNWNAYYETSVASNVSPAVLKSVLQSVDNYAKCFKFNAVERDGTTGKKYPKSLTSR